MKELITLRPMTYGTRRMRAGDSFSATESHARLLVALGRARNIVPPSIPPAEPDPAVQAEVPTKRKRTYRRRDMKAED
jgi:hypothetical protein